MPRQDVLVHLLNDKAVKVLLYISKVISVIKFSHQHFNMMYEYVVLFTYLSDILLTTLCGLCSQYPECNKTIKNHTIHTSNMSI